MTENLKNGVPVQLSNPPGFVAQKTGPETNLLATLALDDRPAFVSSGKRPDTVGELVGAKGEPPFGAVGRDCLEQADIRGGDADHTPLPSQRHSPTVSSPLWDS